MRKISGTLFILDVDLLDWACLYDSATVTDLDRFGDPWPRLENSQPLTDEDLRLSRTFANFSGLKLGRHKIPRYGYSDLSRDFISERGKPAGQSSPSSASANTAFASAPSTTKTLTTTTTVTTPTAESAQPVVVAASQESVVTQTTMQFKTTEAATLVEVFSAPKIDPPFAVPETPMLSDAAISQRPSVQATSTGTINLSFPTLASVPLQPTVMPSRPALLPSPHVDTGAVPSPPFASTSTKQYSGAFDSVSSQESRFASVSTPAPQMSPLH